MVKTSLKGDLRSFNPYRNYFNSLQYKCTLSKLKCSDDRTVAKKCNKMFDAGKVSKICLYLTGPFHITALVMCSRLFFSRTIFCVFSCIFQLGVVPVPNF